MPFPAGKTVRGDQWSGNWFGVMIEILHKVLISQHSAAASFVSHAAGAYYSHPIHSTRSLTTAIALIVLTGIIAEFLRAFTVAIVRFDPI